MDFFLGVWTGFFLVFLGLIAWAAWPSGDDAPGPR